MRTTRALAAIAAIPLALGLAAAPAHAHGLGGDDPTNVETSIVAIEPARHGISVEVVDLGRSLELRNATRSEVVVLGYEGEPYLRVGSDGVFENRRSPASYQNRTLDPPGEVPARYDAQAAPEWRRTGNGTTVRWHDHRAHYMGSGSFPGTRTFTVELTVDGEPVVARGALRWVTAPPWWPWALATAALGVVVVLAARRAYRVTAVLMLTALVVGEVVHVAGSWRAVADTFAGRAGAQALSLGAVALGLIAAHRAVRAPVDRAAPWVLVAAVALLVAGGFGDVSAWYRSQLPSDLAAPVVRGLVALSFGGSAGLIAASATRLAPPPEPAGAQAAADRATS